MTGVDVTSPDTLGQAIEQIGNRLDASPLALMLDIDGTLAPIAPTPALAHIPPATRLVLERLAALPGVVVALVSGRAADDARRMGAIPGAWVIGNHGYELMSPQGDVTVRTDAATFEEAIAEAARRLAGIEMIEGALLEDKRWTLSVHYRNVAHDVADLENRARAVAADLGLRVTDGKKVVELRPPIDVDKGTAALEFAARHALPAGVVLYAGDDRTDEDAFRALRPTGRAVTLQIGSEESDGTDAEFVLRSPAELHELLGWLLRRRLGVA